MAQITTASSAARPVSLVGRAAAAIAAACAGDGCACWDGAGARVEGRVAEVLLDPQELVVLGDALAAGGGAGLDLAGVGGDGEVGDEGVVGITRAVGVY